MVSLGTEVHAIAKKKEKKRKDDDAVKKAEAKAAKLAKNNRVRLLYLHLVTIFGVVSCTYVNTLRAATSAIFLMACNRSVCSRLGVLPERSFNCASCCLH